MIGHPSSTGKSSTAICRPSNQFHSSLRQAAGNVGSDTFIPTRKQSFTLFRQSDLAAESTIDGGKLATDIPAADNEKMGRRMNRIEQVHRY